MRYLESLILAGFISGLSACADAADNQTIPTGTTYIVPAGTVQTVGTLTTGGHVIINGTVRTGAGQ